MEHKKKLVTVVVAFLAVVMFLGMSSTAEAKSKKIPSLSKAKITLSKSRYTYNGKAKKPTVTVKIGKKKLKKNKDYTVTYSSNKKVGKAKVTVKAKKKSKNCKGKKSKNFTIVKASRSVIPAKKSYSAVEGDGAFNITAKASKGGGTITYSCSTTNVIKVTKTGKVTVVKRGTANVKISVAATASYKAASVTVPVTISKKPVRAFDTEQSIKNFKYPTLQYACETKKLTDFQWSVVTKYAMPGLAPTADDDLTKGYIQCNNLCPQGICFAGDYLLTTAYCMDGVHNSCIFIYNRTSGEYLKTLVLKKKSHVGGVTFDGENIWICHSDSYDLQRIPYTSIAKYATGKKGWVQPDELELKEISSKPSAIAYNALDGYLWVAQYIKSKTKGSEMYAYQYKDGQLTPVRKILYSEERDYLGIDSKDASEEACDQVGVASGAAVAAVYTEKSGLKDDAGKAAVLKEGDIIVKLGNQVISGQNDVEAALKSYKSGSKVALTALRAGKTPEDVMTLSGTVTLGERGEVLCRSIPNRVQGVAFTPGGKAIFSRSTGRNLEKPYFISELMVYDATWSKDPTKDYKWKEELAVALPPMVEEVEVYGDEVYMIFESAATTYLEGTDGSGKSDSPIDKIISVKLNLD